MIFRAVTDDIDKSQVHLALFKTNLTGVKNELNSPDTTGFAKIGQALSGLNAKLLATKALALALNTAISMGLAYAGTKVVEWYDKQKNAEKYAAEEARKLSEEREELRQKGAQNSKTYKEESKEIANLVSQYVSMVSSATDVATLKESLAKLQDQTIDKYGQEARGIDLVNKGLEENIRLLTEQQGKRDSKWLRDNSESITEAKRIFSLSDINGVGSATAKSTGIGGTLHSSYYEASATEAKIYYKTIQDILEKEYPDVLGSIFYKTEALGEEEGIEFGENFLVGVKEGLTAEQQMNAVNAIVDAYEKSFQLRKDVGKYINADSIMQPMYEWQRKYQDAYEIIERAQELTSKNENLNQLKKDSETYKEYQKLLSTLKELSAEYNDTSATVADRIDAGQKLQETIIALKEIAVQYPAVSDIIEKSLSGVGLSLSDVAETVENTKETWLKSLDEAQKGILSNVDKITSAMAKLTSGEAIDSKAAWDIINLDDNKLLSNISIDANGDYIFDLEQMVKLKDEILQKEIETREESIKTAKQNAKTAEENIKVAESQIYALRPKMAAAYDSGDKELIAELEAEYERLKGIVESNRSSLEAYNYTIRNESLYVTELKKRLGDLTNTVDMLKAKVEQLKKAVSNLEKEAEARLKAQEHVIDGIIDKFQKEADELEKQKEVLDEQLETLEKQKDELDEIIGNYKTVSDFVSNTIEKQIDEIEDSKSKIEEYYDSLIEKLKEENEERQDAIDKEEKLAALANAQNNKVRYYDAERGWTYGVDQDALKKAQNDLDKTLKDEQIKDLEKQKKEEISPLEEEIKALKEWSEEWSNATDFITEAENELLAEEILGSDWREKIKSKDIATLDAFKARYKNYNDSLKNIVNTEMKSLKDSIKAKEDEIAVKKKQIQAWQDYKSKVQSAANDIKNGLEGYVAYLNTVKLTEASTNEERLNNLNSFTTAYKGLIQTITSYNTEIDATEGKINNLSTSFTKVAGTVKDMSSTVSDYVGRLGEVDDVMGSIFPETQNSSGGFLGGISGIGNSMSTLNKPIEDLIKEIIKIFQKSIFDKIPHYAEGGVNTTTGFAWMDGTKANPELILNSADISRLYNWIHNMPNSVKSINNNSNTGGVMFSIGHMDINGVQNPTEFAREFERQINRYWSTKLTESKVY